MAFVVFKGERKLTELVERAYGPDLTAADRKRAVAAIERANPHLANLKDVAAGSLVVVPRVPGLTASAARVADPASQGVREIAEALQAYRQVLDGSLEQAAGRVAEVKETIALQALRDVVLPEAGGAERLERIAGATRDREVELERGATVVEGMAKVRDELVALADRLR
jgi:hypothetical protein